MKIFCIGINKTATTSLEVAWRILGYDNIYSPNSTRNQEIVYAGLNKDYSLIFRVIKHFELFKDRPFNTVKMYKMLDKHFLDCKFILTTRDEESWWNSTNKWLSFNNSYHPTDDIRLFKIDLYKKHFETNTFSKESFIKYYREYNNEVREYFKGNPNFLEMNICDGDGWDKLCPFLGVEIPDRPFPKENVNNMINGI